jgi:hypothetical protein
VVLGVVQDKVGGVEPKWLKGMLKSRLEIVKVELVGWVLVN